MADSARSESQDRAQLGSLKSLNARARIARQNRPRERIAWLLAALILVLGGLDVISTTAALADGNEELNPLIGSLQTYLGNWWGLPKIFIHLLFAYFVVWLPTKRMLGAASIVIVFYALVVISNFTLAS